MGCNLRDEVEATLAVTSDGTRGPVSELELHDCRLLMPQCIWLDFCLTGNDDYAIIQCRLVAMMGFSRSA